MPLTEGFYGRIVEQQMTSAFEYSDACSVAVAREIDAKLSLALHASTPSLVWIFGFRFGRDDTLPFVMSILAHSPCDSRSDDEKRDENENTHGSNENKMSDGGRGRASLGVEMWKSSEM
jgi:hypothetical protein